MNSRSFWLFTAAIALSADKVRTVTLASGRGCGPGQNPGPGSAPCTKQYDGSGDISATEPSAFASSHFWPGCTCPIPMPGLAGTRGARVKDAPGIPDAPLTAGEVEVLTVDVRVANRVRCENASIAEDVAKMLKIPVKRITVTPWSWTLPNTPQSNYLAFVQEDHDRCDCERESGKVVQGQGFKKAASHGSTDGWMLGSDTSVMTVSQYKALHGDSSSAPFTANSDARVGATAPPESSAAKGPPASRVQMLTRDPCLVHLLREKTPQFKKRIAFLLGVPEDKVIINPPPVKGTVGLLQLDTTLNSESEVSQVQVLAVRQCNLASIGEMEEGLGLEANVAASAPASANLLSPSPAAYPVFSVAASNITNGADAMNVTQKRVSLVVKLDNINYDVLAESLSLVRSFTTVAKAAIGEAGHVPASAVEMALYPGALVVESSLAAPAGTAPEAVLAFLDGTVCHSMVNQLSTVSALGALMSGPLGCSVVSLALEDPPSEPDEANRAWIAFWSITVLPPYAQEGAWHLLSMVNKPMTELSKLLPLTLARIPGLKYRALQEPNAAIKGANETRLPPPMDKAVGFDMAQPYTEEAALEAGMKTMHSEKTARSLMVKPHSTIDEVKAQEALQAAKSQANRIKEATAQLSNAARAHASAIRSRDAQRGPDIVPYDVLRNPLLGNESPYPWRDQMPNAKHTTGLVQDASPHERLRPPGRAKLR